MRVKVDGTTPKNINKLTLIGDHHAELWKIHTLYYSEGPLGIIIPDPFWWVFYGFPVVQPLSHTYPFQT